MKTTSIVSILQTMRTNHHIYLWLCYWRKIGFTVFAHIVSFIFYYHQPWKIWTQSMLLLYIASYCATLNSKKGKLKHHEYKPMCVPFIFQWRLSVKIEIFLIDCHFFFLIPWPLMTLTLESMNWSSWEGATPTLAILQRPINVFKLKWFRRLWTVVSSGTNYKLF